MELASSSVRTWLRLEGLAVLAAAVLLYRALGASWILFAALFLVPDLSLFGYLAGPRAGAAVYNVAHSYVLPAVLMLVAYSEKKHLGIACALIWAAHIGFDRTLGYGLKYPSAFKDTHLGEIGRRKIL